jgi:hypothetical protein
MSWRDENQSVNDRWQASPNATDRARRQAGPRLGPVALTPTRVTLFLALAGSLAFLLYAITVRDASQIPMLSSGAAVLGLVFAALAVAGVISTFRAARDGRGGRAVLLALLGGCAALVAFGCLSWAVILALVYKA